MDAVSSVCEPMNSMPVSFSEVVDEPKLDAMPNTFTDPDVEFVKVKLHVEPACDTANVLRDADPSAAITL